MNFEQLGLKDTILQAVEREHFKEPTEIQIKTIPLILEGKDVIAQSATGSGKTLAFGAGIIQHTVHGKGLQALVLTPTRELTEQVTQALQKFCHNQLSIQAIYGGVGIGPQIRALPNADVVVATPGRMLDHLERGTIQLNKIHTLVLDESDRMIDMGFIRDVERILHGCPKERQTLLFSATLSPEIGHIARKHMKTPIKVIAETYVDPSKLSQIYYDVPRNQKLSLLAHFIQQETSGLVMVFCNTRRITDFVAKALKHANIYATPIHGGLTQSKRSNTLERFHSQKSQVLVCTDVAARGLDIQGVSHIYNYDIPNDPKQYVHRIGRTARAGKEGKVINLLSPQDHDYFGMVLREYNIKIAKGITPKVQPLQVPAQEERPRRFSPRTNGPRHGEARRNFGGSSSERPQRERNPRDRPNRFGKA
ncbi:MAG: DEAD/DEAH box helicase [Nanoarchaeota archaeon]